MKTRLIVIAIGVVLLRSASAQIPSIKEGAAVQQVHQNGTSGQQFVVWKKTIENQASSSMVALEAIFRCPATGFYKQIAYTSLRDSLENYGHDIDVPPGGSVEISAFDPDRCPGSVEAVIFSDGHSEGNPKAIEDLYLRRRGIDKMLAEIQEHLDKIVAQQETSEAMVSALTNLDKANGENQALNISERKGMSYAIGVAKQILQSGSGLAVPANSAEKRPPNIASVMQEMNVSHEQAQAMVLNKELEQWRSALEAHLDMPSSAK